MKKRLIRDGVFLMGAVDWNRRLFDSLIPLPEGTSYNAYLVEGSEKTALIDTADPELEHVLLAQLEDVKKIDYIISLHTEQDHSGAIPTLLDMYPEARVVCSPKAKELLQDHLHIDEGVCDDPLKSLRFFHLSRDYLLDLMNTIISLSDKKLIIGR